MFLSKETMAVILGLGLTPEQTLELYGALERDFRVVERITAPAPDPVHERKKQADRERIAAKRAADRAAKDATTPSDCSATEASDVALQDETEEVTPPSPALSPQTPLTHPHPPEESTTREGLFVTEPEEAKPKTKRGTRLPEDWWPNDAERQMARDAGLTPEETDHAAREFRNYWTSRTRDATRTYWDRVWDNRVNDIGTRKREKLARQAGPRPGGRGSWGLADHLMWERSQGGD